MKKFIFAFALICAMTMSCTGRGASTSDSIDSIAVDSVDTVMVDSIAL